MEVDDVDQVGSPAGPPPALEDKPSDQPKGKTSIKPTAALTRESEKSLLPISRMQKIMKATRYVRHRALHAPSSLTPPQELLTVAKEATFLISLANGRIYQKVIRS
jgi:hypothetical protein